MFCMIFPSGTKTFQSVLVFKIIEGGKWCFWYSKSITKVKFELKPNLELHQDVLTESAFYKKGLVCPLSLNCTLGTILVFLDAAL